MMVTVSNSQISQTQYFKNLDGLRFFSFLSVFISHAQIFPVTSSRYVQITSTIFSLNYLGVPFFFSLSGFLITYNLLAEKERVGKLRLLKFYKNRILRIWPAYLIILSIYFVLMPFAASQLHAKAPTLPSILPFLLFYVNFFIIENGSYFTFALAILWSISVEEQFYLFWGAIMKHVSKVYLGKLFTGLFLLSIIFSFYYLYVHDGTVNNLAIHTLFVIQNFCAGALCASAARKNIFFSISKRLKKILLISAYFVLPLAYLFIANFIILNILKSCCFALIIYDQSFNDDRFFNAGKSRHINYLGKISYGLYLYHAMFLILLRSPLSFLKLPVHYEMWNSFLQSTVALIITIIVAHLSYKYIEIKFLALKTK